MADISKSKEVSEDTTSINAPAETKVEGDAPMTDTAPPAPDVTTVATETHDHVAIRDFKARFDHQLLSFAQGEIIDSRVGKALRATGSPIKLVEKLAEETKGRL